MSSASGEKDADTIACVIDDRLYISSLKVAEDKNLLKASGITHILTVGCDMRPIFRQDFSYQVVGNIDDEETAPIYSVFKDCFSFMDHAFQQDGKVLVHCEGGVSRSATVCAAYLMYIDKPNLSAKDAIAYMQSVRSVTLPNAGFRAQLKLFEESGFSLNLEMPIIKQKLRALNEENRARAGSKPSIMDNVFFTPALQVTLDNKDTSVGDVKHSSILTLRNSPLSKTKHLPIRSQSLMIESHFAEHISRLRSRKDLNPQSSSPLASSIEKEELGSMSDLESESPPDKELPIRLKPRSSSTEDASKRWDEKNSVRNQVLTRETSRKSEANDDNEQTKAKAADAVERIMNGIDVTSSDTELVTRWLALQNLEIDPETMFIGLKQTWSLMKFLIVYRILVHVDHNHSPGTQMSKDTENAQRDFKALENSLQHISVQLEKYTGYPLTPDIRQMLQCSNRLNNVLSNLETEFRAALQAIRSNVQGTEGFINSTSINAYPIPNTVEEAGNCSDTDVRKREAVTPPPLLVPKIKRNSLFQSRNSESKVHSSKFRSRLNRNRNKQKAKKKEESKNTSIDLLLLFSRLGLHHDLSSISDKSYRRLSQMLQGGTNERDALAAIDQNSAIELLGHLETSKDPQILRLASVVETKLVLMVEKKTVGSICDQLLEKPRLRGAVRRVATYCLHFSSAFLSMQMYRHNMKQKRKALYGPDKRMNDHLPQSLKMARPTSDEPIPYIDEAGREESVDDNIIQVSRFRSHGLLNKSIIKLSTGSKLEPSNTYYASAVQSSRSGNIRTWDTELDDGGAIESSSTGSRLRPSFANQNHMHHSISVPTKRRSFRERLSHRISRQIKLKPRRSSNMSLPENNEIDPADALNGILKHLCRVSSTKLVSNGYTQGQFRELKSHLNGLKKVHPIICVADTEVRPGIGRLPKASRVLEEVIENNGSGYGENQTPYIFDFELGILAFFRPCDHDTALQRADDTSAKFRSILRTIFGFLPNDLGGETALKELTQTTTMSQHACAGFALSTILHFIDSNIMNRGTDYSSVLFLGDEMEGITGTVAGGYLHYSGGKYIFSEESGHYGPRWTKPGIRQRFNQFMEDSGFGKDFVLKPYVRQSKFINCSPSVSDVFQRAEQNLVENQSCLAGPVEDQTTGQDEMFDMEWDFG